jgi:hypothetical protein
MSSSDDAWPALAYADWADTCNTLHLWTQIVGKVKLRLAPLVNHWWGVVLFVTARGLTTGAMPYRGRALQVDFDFCAHELVLRTGRRARAAHRARADGDGGFLRRRDGRLARARCDVSIWTMPSEIEGAIPFEQDRVHASYDRVRPRRPSGASSCRRRACSRFFARATLGKVSPVHFFWGSFDLAVTRFSGRAAPPLTGGKTPNVAPWVMQEAYSHECSSLGFWPGNGGYGRAAFYAYAYPEPDGFGAQPVRPAGAAYNADVGQFLIDYDAVRAAASPDDALLDFAQSTMRRRRTKAGGTGRRWKGSRRTSG